MRLVFISDTHGKHHNVSVPDGDALIHCGDFSSQGALHEIQNFNAWMKKQPHALKLAIPGNHELGLSSSHASPEFIELAQEALADVKLLLHEAFEWQGVRFFGSPWTPEFRGWAFNYPHNKDVWGDVPMDTDVLITHGPPYGVLDQLDERGSEPGLHVGCLHLRRAVRRIEPRIHAFGHIHEGAGLHAADGTLFVNASQLDSRYRHVNLPVVVNI